MIVEVAVGGSDEMLGDSVTEQNVGHAVLSTVHSGLIESCGGRGGSLSGQLVHLEDEKKKTY